MTSGRQPPDSLHLSQDRKVAPVSFEVKNKGRPAWAAAVQNSFGLPSGISCPGKTGFCESCYGANAENAWSNARRLLYHNLSLILLRRQEGCEYLLDEMMDRFEEQWLDVVGNEPMIFRVHWDGDFVHRDYLDAWLAVMRRRPHITFWAYTRSFDMIHSGCLIDNFTLYLSIDEENFKAAQALRATYPWLMGAYCASTYRRALAMAENRTVRCPENALTQPLVNSDGEGACTTCRLCITGKTDIAFASTHREDVAVSIHRKQGVLF